MDRGWGRDLGHGRAQSGDMERDRGQDSARGQFLNHEAPTCALQLAFLKNHREIHSKFTVLSEATKKSSFSKSDTQTGCLKVDYNVFLSVPSDAAPPGRQQPPRLDPAKTAGQGDPSSWETGKGQSGNHAHQ